MPYAIPSGAVLEVTIQGKQASQTVLSVFHYQLTDLLAIPDGRAFIDVFDTSFNIATGTFDLFRLACSSAVTFDQIIYQWITPTRFRRVSKTPFVGVGNSPAPALPPNSAQVITKRSDQADRHGVSTLHVPGVPAADVTDGNLSVAQKAKLDALGATLLPLLVTGRMTPVIFNRALPAASRQISSTLTQGTVRTMRRRTVGVGI